MSELIVWPRPVVTLYEFLTEQLAMTPGHQDVKASGIVPSPRPPRFVRVRPAGGQQIDLVTTEPLLIVESWARKDEDAEALAWTIHSIIRRAHLDGMLGAVPVRQIRTVSLPQPLPDTSGQPRYSAMYAPQMRGRAA